MSDRKFENQVRHKLDNLKLTPSPVAWERIEKRLQERKRRRVPFWIPILLLSVAAGGYFIFSPRHPSPSLVFNQAETVIQKVLPGGQRSKVNAPKVGANIILPANPADRPALIAERSQPLTPSSYKKKDRFIYFEESGKKLNATSSRGVKNNYQHIFKEEKLPVDDPATEGKNQEINTDLQNSEKNTSAEEKYLLEKDLLKSGQPVTSRSNPPVRKKKNTQSKKWVFGLSASSGVAAVTDGNPLSSSRTQVEDVSYTFASTQPTGFTSPTTYIPSTISPAFAYSMGAVVKRKLSKRFELSAGVNYLQLNTRSHVGEQVTGNQIVNNGRTGYLYVASYYTLQQDRSSTYKNRYHFIDFPVNLHTRINKSEKLPVYWNAGIAISRLLSSNSLHFDGTTGVYYKNDNLMNLTQAAVSSGFSFSVFNKKTTSLWVGPSARYNLSEVLRKDVSTNKHFMSLGLDVKWFLK